VTTPAPEPTEEALPSHAQSPHNWKTSTETAHIIGVHPNYLRLIPSADLRYYRIGRMRRYKLTDIEAYIETLAVS
jgi:hypothetical protein